MTAPSNANTSGLGDVGLSETYRFAYESIRNGAPGLSDATCAAIARSINMKVSLSKIDPAADADRVRIEDDLREARAIITETVEEFGCTIDLYNKHGPHWTSADGEMFYVGVVLDREPLIERGRAFLAALKSEGK